MTTRREFIRAATAAAVGATCAPSIHLPGRRRYDILIRGGHVLDGDGSAGLTADIAIVSGRIVAVGPALGDDARMLIDARGYAVAPGFVDIHSHADGTLFDDPRAESVIRQGITTVVVGQDGGSRFPALPRPLPVTPDSATARTFPSIFDFFQAVDRLPPAVNVASMVGLGTVRRIEIGDAARPPTAVEIRRMVERVEAAIANGACGASSGLEYAPGAFASRDELAALCRPLAVRRLPYATHMRNEDDALLDSIDEAIAVARDAGCPLEVSHLKTQGERNWPKIEPALERIEGAARAGLDVTFDRYPYTAYQTGLSNLFPQWSQDGGNARFLARLADASFAERLQREVLSKVQLIGGWNNVLVSSVSAPADRAAEGKRLGDYATSLGKNPYAVAKDLLVRSRGVVGMVGFAMSEENLARFLAHPRGMVCSDGGSVAIQGPARAGHPHPRSLGSFPRVLARYVRERKDLTLGGAIRKMTSLPASRVRLAERGRLLTGFAADLVIFDPQSVRDRATYADPFQYPEGINIVIVNGSPALIDGVREQARAGRTLRP